MRLKGLSLNPGGEHAHEHVAVDLARLPFCLILFPVARLSPFRRRSHYSMTYLRDISWSPAVGCKKLLRRIYPSAASNRCSLQSKSACLYLNSTAQHSILGNSSRPIFIRLRISALLTLTFFLMHRDMLHLGRISKRTVVVRYEC